MKYLTIKDYDKIEQLASEKRDAIPKSHNRKQLETYHNTIIQGIKESKTRTAGKPKYIVYTHNVNLGSRKWAYIVKVSEIEDITGWKENAKTYTKGRNRINKDNIIAIVK